MPSKKPNSIYERQGILRTYRGSGLLVRTILAQWADDDLSSSRSQIHTQRIRIERLFTQSWNTKGTLREVVTEVANP